MAGEHGGAWYLLLLRAVSLRLFMEVWCGIVESLASIVHIAVLELIWAKNLPGVAVGLGLGISRRIITASWF